jgi:hypothetical protein
MSGWCWVYAVNDRTKRCIDNNLLKEMKQCVYLIHMRVKLTQVLIHRYERMSPLRVGAYALIAAPPEPRAFAVLWRSFKIFHIREQYLLPLRRGIVAERPSCTCAYMGDSEYPWYGAIALRTNVLLLSLGVILTKYYIEYRQTRELAHCCT